MYTAQVECDAHAERRARAVILFRGGGGLKRVLRGRIGNQKQLLKVFSAGHVSKPDPM